MYYHAVSDWFQIPLTLFVTVLANFLMLLRLPFSHRIAEYMTSIFAPMAFLDRYFRPLGVLVGGVISIGARREMGVLDLEIAEAGFGVRGSDTAGVWKA